MAGRHSPVSYSLEIGTRFTEYHSSRPLFWSTIDGHGHPTSLAWRLYLSSLSAMRAILGGQVDRIERHRVEFLTYSILSVDAPEDGVYVFQPIIDSKIPHVVLGEVQGTRSTNGWRGKLDADYSPTIRKVHAGSVSHIVIYDDVIMYFNFGSLGTDLQGDVRVAGLSAFVGSLHGLQVLLSLLARWSRLA
ncbi:hypothetical protein FA13DRAFT_876649 [Coprinellus micaceus]|uniref:Uncharacterized protein n=1 Tax=Coprinellus micaceus TaxID=71717 RepID=A0A4Y7T102_COPMI|nr:hypothetical protein FA13DRAFT_876649 [Coprinellus micaceus]